MSCRIKAPAYRISIHALREEGDVEDVAQDDEQGYFYPRPPRGGRRLDQLSVSEPSNFYPRPPRGGRHGQRGQACS